MTLTTACLFPAFCNCERCKFAHRPQDVCICGHQRSSHLKKHEWKEQLSRVPPWVCALCNGCTGFRLKEEVRQLSYDGGCGDADCELCQQDARVSKEREAKHD
jgi:hypothetical protein